ncbi:MAG: hypothetical protein DWQ08_10660 [Proteobacteria bacterium]|nr:MAG: hypothetical protein DWQ08_10660 [Pseudomonadota bacterium]
MARKGCPVYRFQPLERQHVATVQVTSNQVNIPAAPFTRWQLIQFWRYTVSPESACSDDHQRSLAA